MSSHLKNFLGRRRSSNQPPSSSHSHTSTLSGLPPQTTSPPAGSSLTPPPNPNASQISLPQGQQPNPQMQNPNQLGRPPSYTYAPPGQQLNAPPQHGRPHSPMPPPPINRISSSADLRPAASRPAWLPTATAWALRCIPSGPAGQHTIQAWRCRRGRRCGQEQGAIDRGHRFRTFLVTVGFVTSAVY
jgi:hypothetical protein